MQTTLEERGGRRRGSWGPYVALAGLLVLVLLAITAVYLAGKMPDEYYQSCPTLWKSETVRIVVEWSDASNDPYGRKPYYALLSDGTERFCARKTYWLWEQASQHELPSGIYELRPGGAISERIYVRKSLWEKFPVTRQQVLLPTIEMHEVLNKGRHAVANKIANELLIAEEKARQFGEALRLRAD